MRVSSSCFGLLAACIWVGAGLTPVSAQCVESQKITPNSGVTAYFGHDLALDGHRVLIARRIGDADVYRRQLGQWVKETGLYEIGAEGFGSGVALDNGIINLPRAFVGASDDDDAARFAGSIVMFGYDGAEWYTIGKTFPADVKENDHFGWSLDTTSTRVNEGKVLVGSPYWDGTGSNTGAAHVFTYSAHGFLNEEVLIPDDLPTGAYYGEAVSIDASWNGSAFAYTAAISAPYAAKGLVYVYRYDPSNEKWTQEARLAASDGGSYDQFGVSLSLEGNVLAVGAPYHDAYGDNAGAVYVYRYNGTQWVEEAKLSAQDTNFYDEFGSSVAVHGTQIAVGAGAGENWYGVSGSAYLFEHDGSQWNEIQKLIPSDSGFSSDRFGDAIGLGDYSAIVGAPENDACDTECGAVYATELPCQEITPPDLVLGHSGGCGEPTTFAVFNAYPDARLAVVYGFSQGSSGPVPGCEGLTVDIKNAQLASIFSADSFGNGQFAAKMPAQACDTVIVQAIDLTSCRTSNRYTLYHNAGYDLRPPGPEFFQNDYLIDGQATPNSDWGSMHYTFIGHSGFKYVNLSVNNTWQIQNAPLQSIQGEGALQTIVMDFDLGNDVGQDVSEITYGLALTDSPVMEMPPSTRGASVGNRDVEMSSGTGDALLPSTKLAAPLVGGEVSSNLKHHNTGFPNQDCGPMECGPAAVSNSLIFLNQKNGLGFGMGAISIGTLKEVLQWSPITGVWIWDDVAKGRTAWWRLKDAAYHNSITTTRIPPPSRGDLCNGNVDSVMQAIMNALDSNCDIEITVTGHVAALVGVTKLADGTYDVDVADDGKQGKNIKGDTDLHRGKFDPKTCKLTYDGREYKLYYFVVECVN